MASTKTFANKSTETKYNNHKLPLKSVNGRRCLSKCYPKGESYLHPVLMTAVANKTQSSCAIEPIHSRDKHYVREHEMIMVDVCRLDDNQTYKPPDELESLLLSFYFNPSDFLASTYDLHSFDQVIYWTLENDSLPFDTIKRVHNCAWKVFGNKIEEISSSVLEYYYDISKNYWLKEYAKIIEKEYSFDFITDKLSGEISDTTNEIYQILLERYYSFDFFISTIKRYIYEYEDNWEMIETHYSHLKKYILNQLVEHINNSQNKS